MKTVMQKQALVPMVLLALWAFDTVQAQMPVPSWLLPKIQQSSSVIQIAMHKEAMQHPEGAYEASLVDTPLYKTLMDHNLAGNWARILTYSKVGINKIRSVFGLPTLEDATKTFSQFPSPSELSALEQKELDLVQQRMLRVKQLRNPSLCYAATKTMTDCGLFADHTIALLAYRVQLGCAQGTVSSFLNYEVETEIYQNSLRCDAVREVLLEKVPELNEAILNIGAVVANEIDNAVKNDADSHSMATSQSDDLSESEGDAPTETLSAEASHNSSLVKGRRNRLVKRGLGRALAFSIIAFPIWLGASIISQGSIIPTFLIMWGFLYTLSLGEERA